MAEAQTELLDKARDTCIIQMNHNMYNSSLKYDIRTKFNMPCLGLGASGSLLTWNRMIGR